MIGDTLLIDWVIRKLFKNDPNDLGPRMNAVRAFMILGGFISVVVAITIWLAR
jgi:hypothetical protein